mmetsp:Transcript_14484/g.47585  ORF Transcript_14484/g.47585 Transcript_14484/m.47585 type:complete len:275 (+) Transcript_14484:256-1080(+)
MQMTRDRSAPPRLSPPARACVPVDAKAKKLTLLSHSAAAGSVAGGGRAAHPRPSCCVLKRPYAEEKARKARMRLLKFGYSTSVASLSMPLSGRKAESAMMMPTMMMTVKSPPMPTRKYDSYLASTVCSPPALIASTAGDITRGFPSAVGSNRTVPSPGGAAVPLSPSSASLSDCPLLDEPNPFAAWTRSAGPLAAASRALARPLQGSAGVAPRARPDANISANLSERSPKKNDDGPHGEGCRCSGLRHGVCAVPPLDQQGRAAVVGGPCEDGHL